MMGYDFVASLVRREHPPGPLICVSFLGEGGRFLAALGMTEVAFGMTGGVRGDDRDARE